MKFHITAVVALLLMAACAAAAESVPSVSSQSVELSPSVQLVGKYDWELIKTEKGETWSRCLDMVWRAVDAGSSRINFVPTHHWLPDETSPNGISSFCYMDTVAPSSEATLGKDQYECFPWSQSIIQEYPQAMQVCFAEALRQGLTIYVRPHLDDGTLKGAWRNGLLMEPTTKYGEFSYQDIMLVPLADALREAIAITMAEETIKPPPGGTQPTVYFAMQGEMSATVMRFASEWSKLVDPMRGRILGKSSNVTVKIGVGLNFNRLDDTSSVTKEWGSSRLSWLAWQVGVEPPAGSREGVPQINDDALRDLFNNKLDFLGVSAYAAYRINGGSIDLDEYENSAFMLCNEMKDSYNIDIKGLANSGKLELQYSEFGIGGGTGYGGGQVARTPSEVALRPYFGVYGVYTADRDPWSVPANSAFRKTFYYRAMQWLADPKIKTHKVSSVFIWSMASWDVLGVYPESTNGEGSYRDVEIVSAVAAYNKAVRAAAESAKPADSATGSNSDSKQDGGNSKDGGNKEGQGSTGGSSGSNSGSDRPAVRVVVVGPEEQQRLPASG